MTRRIVVALLLVVGLIGPARAGSVEEDVSARPRTPLDEESLGELTDWVMPHSGPWVLIELPRSYTGKREVRLFRIPWPEQDPEFHRNMEEWALIQEISRAWDILNSERYLTLPDGEGDAWYRLGRAIEDWSRFRRAQELDTYHGTMEACLDSGRADCTDVVEPDFDTSSQGEIAALAIYLHLRWKFPNHPASTKAAARSESLRVALE